MTEHDDELAALTAADPELGRLPADPGDPDAVALFERIVMNDSEVRSEAPAWRRPVLVGAAAVALVIAGVVGTLVVAGGDDGPATDAVEEVATDDTVTPGAPITPGGVSTGSCVEVYDLQTLANREVAFAGTVSSVDGDTATFDVERSFRGVDGETITLRGASTLGGLTSAGGPTLEPGARLLVAGDGGFAWACGFTQPHDDAVAAEWEQVFAG